MRPRDTATGRYLKSEPPPFDLPLACQMLRRGDSLADIANVCGVSERRARAELNAAGYKVPRKQRPRDEVSEAEVVRRRKAGEKFSAIAGAMDITRQRAQQIWKRWRESHEDDE